VCAFVRLAENYKGNRVDCSKAVRDTAGMRVIDFYCLSNAAISFYLCAMFF